MKKLVLCLLLFGGICGLLPQTAEAYCVYYGPDNCDKYYGTYHPLGGCTTECGDCFVEQICYDEY